MSSDAIAIRVRDVSKHYLLFNRPLDRLKQSIVPRLQRLAGRKPKRYYRDFAALSHVSFDVRRGETVGVIGRNGSGKSTLLQIVCGTLRPNAGTVEVNGRVAALLELGAGFNPEFTGRENVYLNAAILGLSRKEIDARFEEIARFADIGDFIEQPVKTYSSGMYVRLAFATAINVDPDILVVDEALAVGDEAFQRKCFARIEQIQERGGTILFVTHGAQTVVQLCTRALLFDRGELILDGRPKLVTSQYQRLLNVTADHAQAIRKQLRSLPPENIVSHDDSSADPGPSVAKICTHNSTQDSSWLDPQLKSQSHVDYPINGAKITDLAIINMMGSPVNVIARGHRYTLRYKVTFSEPAENVSFGFLIKTISGIEVCGTGTAREMGRSALSTAPAQSRWTIEFSWDCLMTPGAYFVTAGVGKITDNGERVYLHRLVDAIVFRVAPDAVLDFSGFVDLSVSVNIGADDIDVACPLAIAR